MTEFINPADAQKFYQEGLKQFDQVILNEEEAKRAILLAMASPTKGPTGVALIGGTGGGKTSLSDFSHLLVEGIRDEHIADFPAQSDLRPVEVVGGRVENTVEIRGVNGTQTETKIHTIDGLINKDTKVIKLNEIDTINPQSLNVIREVMASGKLVNTEGVVGVKGLLYFISSKNPRDGRGKFEISDAMVSRHAIGAYMGNDDNQNIDTVNHILDDFEPAEPEDIQAVTDLETLNEIRRFARLGISFPDNLKPETAVRLVAASRALIAKHIDDTPQRLSVQVRDVAKADAALSGQLSIEKHNIDAALRFVLMARIGLRGSIYGESIPEIVNSIVEG